MSEQVAVLDYGMGNLHSVAKALEKVGGDRQVRISSDPETLVAADRLVFPGVGAIRDCMAVLREKGLDQAVTRVAESGRPLLGICVGMQAMLEYSEENEGVDCLGVFGGRVQRFRGGTDEQGARLKIPHMGWNRVLQQDHPLWEGIPDGSRFYFVHSYHAAAVPDASVAGWCEYGERFPAAVFRDNVFAVQFHPEKSAPHGLTLLENFLRWQP